MDHTRLLTRRSTYKHHKCNLLKTSTCFTQVQGGLPLLLVVPLTQCVVPCSLNPALFHISAFAEAKQAWKISLASASEPNPGCLCVAIVFKIVLKWSLWQRELEGKVLFVYPSDDAGIVEIMEFPVTFAFSNQFSSFSTAWLVEHSLTSLSFSFLICQIGILKVTVLNKQD